MKLERFPPLFSVMFRVGSVRSAASRNNDVCWEISFYADIPDFHSLSKLNLHFLNMHM